MHGYSTRSFLEPSHFVLTRQPLHDVDIAGQNEALVHVQVSVAGKEPVLIHFVYQLNNITLLCMVHVCMVCGCI